jgi:hypothetical protein
MGAMHSLSASRLNDFLGCSHRAALWLASIKPEGEVDATLQLIRDKGFYAAYEPTALKRLAMRYATMEAELDQLLREHRFVDLYRVVVQSLRASTEGYSLKDLEAIYWHQRTGEVKTASASIVEYERWCVTKDNTILDSIEDYNKDDCVSTAYLRNWLEGLRPPGAKLEIVDNTAPEEQEQSAARAQLEARKQELAARVRASARGDARVRDLVAELLWFHQRSQKPGWWALFERQAWSEEELIEDPESLGGLRLDTATPPVQVKRSLDTAYCFPPQDTKLKIGDTPRVAETIGYAGSIVELSAEDGRIVLRRGLKIARYALSVQSHSRAPKPAGRSRRYSCVCGPLCAGPRSCGSGPTRSSHAPRAEAEGTGGRHRGAESRRVADGRRHTRGHGPRRQLSVHPGAARYR